jgi:tripeptidyl-peptidase-1
LSKYFAKHDPGYPTYVADANLTNIGSNGGRYNRAGRGYPDVSANGAYMLAYVNGEIGHWYGTSLASPVWAAVTTLLNQQRTLAGKGPVGFLNPVLYEHPWALNDITNGTNGGCKSDGFAAVSGWDP